MKKPSRRFTLRLGFILLFIRYFKAIPAAME